ncbi:probable inactive peptidyl-prolyl cis-trans isomerase-like 6 [Schistocerca gregaria]|uniref:probable inactive peptidyl-prolyl cis-trans isomerase-like 6 n=1 Tax=Schistocerca gregaria TaxID=7010 RepID=UPI00211F3008|nr:probable inactive peptidyl-prolyl cis-trans isomerase-like 6 [Schistocerca gregaria]
MESEDNTAVQINVIGLITSVEYQKAKLCVERLHRHLPYLFSKPVIRGMLEFDWEEFIMRQRREYGHELWAIKEPVIITTDSGYIRGCDKFLNEIATFCGIQLLVETADYYRPMLLDYVDTLTKTKRTHVYMDFTIGKHPAGTIIFQLYSDLLPLTCENFKCLCTGEKGGNDEGILLHYKNTLIHRVVKMGWLQGGDIENRIGGGGASIYGRTFPDESYCISHNRRGVLSMANDGRHTNGSQFIITLQPAPWMDYYYVAFGQVVEGENTLKLLESVNTAYERPLADIEITGCGVFDVSEVEEETVIQPDRCIEEVQDKPETPEEALIRREESTEETSIVMEDMKETAEAGGAKSFKVYATEIAVRRG